MCRPELRALECFDNVPQGCRLHLQADDRHAPHLRVGEFAVIDPTDRQPVSGELYMVRWADTGREAVMQVLIRDEGVWFAPLNRPRNADEAATWMRTGRPIWTGDGPLGPEFLSEYIIGRVLGIFQAQEFAPLAAGAFGAAVAAFQGAAHAGLCIPDVPTDAMVQAGAEVAGIDPEQARAMFAAMVAAYRREAA